MAGSVPAVFIQERDDELVGLPTHCFCGAPAPALLAIASVPEPSVVGLWGLGELVAGGYAWRKKQRAARSR